MFGRQNSAKKNKTFRKGAEDKIAQRRKGLEDKIIQRTKDSAKVWKTK